MAIGEESEVANAMEAVGQGVEQEAPDKLVGLQIHSLDGAAVAVVFPGKGDMIVVAGADAAVGDGDAMGVAPEIGEDLGGSTERLLGVDDPSSAAHMGGEGVEARGFSEVCEVAEEPQDAGVEAFCKRSRKRRRKSFASGLTARKKFGRPATQRVPSGERPPPGTTQCTCG
jgi:hypothetical protein